MAENKFCAYRAEDVVKKVVEDHIAEVDPSNSSGLRGIAGPAMAALIHGRSVQAKKTVPNLPSCMFTNGVCIAPNSAEVDCPIVNGIEAFKSW
jgi:hypothetical protein